MELIKDMFPKRALALCLGAGLLMGLLGCEAEPQVVYKTERKPVNDGGAAVISVDVSSFDEGSPYVEVLNDVIEKYRADFPNTQIKLKEEGQSDIVKVEGSQGGAQGLMDLSEYADFWYGEGTLAGEGSFAMHFMGGDGVFAVPVDMEQPVLYYRSDWFDKFNSDKTTAAEKVRVETWTRFLEIRQKLSDKGRLAIGREMMEDCFNSVLWSVTGNWASASAPYYSNREEGTTLFIHERGPKAMETFGMVMDSAIKDGKISNEEAVDAFVNGEAGMLIAMGSAAGRLKAEMPQGSWEATGLPKGDIGQGVSPVRSWWGFGISDETKEPEKTAHFLCYLTNADNNTHMAAVCGSMPLYKESVNMEPGLLESDRGPEMELLSQADYRYAGAPYFMFPQAEESIIEDELWEFLDGKLSVTQALETLDEKFKTAYREWVDSGKEVPWLEVEED